MLPLILFFLLISREIHAQACTSAGGSGLCYCSGTFLNCGFLNLIGLPGSIPTTTTTLYLNDNNIIGAPVNFFATTPNLQVLHLERNGFFILFTTSLTPLTKLQELWLNLNTISSFPSGLFNSNTLLRLLHLENNLITSIPSGLFNRLTNMQELYLSMNVLTSLPDAFIFSNLTALQTLNLDDNLMTTIPFGVFNKTTALKNLYINNNNIQLLPHGTFTNLTSLANMRMYGNPSYCFLTSANKPSCTCYIGYVGDSTFCEPINCGPSIYNLNVNATAKCTGDTRYLGTNCTASCNVGFLGSPSSFYCNTNGNWTGAITCSAIDCGGTISSLGSNAYANCSSGDTHYLGTNCTATCNSGYLGSGSPLYYCGTNGQWMGNFTCGPIKCGNTIPNLDSNAISPNCTSNTYQSTCTTTCINGFVGGPVTYTCPANGVWSGNLLCSGVNCGRTISGLPGNSSARCRGRTTYTGTNCTASCNAGFVGGSTSYYCSASGNWVLGGSPLACTPLECGPLTTGFDINAASYCTNTHYLGPSCPVICNAGYVGSAQYTCLSTGAWLGSLTCARRDCGSVITNLPPFSQSNCTGDTRYLGTACTAKCIKDYVGASINYTCATDGTWTNFPSSPILCQRRNCGSLLVTPYANFTCTGNTRYQGNNCSTACPSGKIGSPATYRCAINGSWIGNLTCMSPVVPTVAAVVASSSTNIAPIAAGVAIPIALILIVLVVLLALRRKRASDDGLKSSKKSSVSVMPSDLNSDDPSMTINPLHRNFRRRTIGNEGQMAQVAAESHTDFDEGPVMEHSPQRPWAAPSNRIRGTAIYESMS